jgi:DNA repair protein RecO (recombination protein O)
LALLVGRVEQGDSNLVLTLFTQTLGKVSALARNARNSKRRFAGSLEPMHTLSVELDDSGGDLMTLRESTLTTPRHHLIADLASMQCAGLALRWVRHAAPPRTVEPTLWRLLETLLTALDRPQNRLDPQVLLAEFGLQLLPALGWGLQLEQCVRCSRPCPANKKAYVSPQHGGLLCRNCGMARLVLSPELRARMIRATANPGAGQFADQNGDNDPDNNNPDNNDPDTRHPDNRAQETALLAEDCDSVLSLIEQCLATHANFSDS